MIGKFIVFGDSYSTHKDFIPEGYPHYYIKETVKVKLGKKTVEAMVYIMNDGYKFNPPSVYYYETIREGYKDNNLPLNKLENAYHYTAGKMRMEHGLKD